MFLTSARISAHFSATDLLSMASASCRLISVISARTAANSCLIFRALAGPKCAPGSRCIPCASRLSADIWASGGKDSLQIRAHSCRIHLISWGPCPLSRLRVLLPKTIPGATWRVVIMMCAWGFSGLSQWIEPVTATPYLWRKAVIKSQVSRIFCSSVTSRGRAMLIARAVLASLRFSACSAAAHRSAVSTGLPSAR